ncbi:MAG: ATP synthase F0 subunit B [Nitrospinae bacterium CG11_big_fil_rev_8_21_14_0_20_56_8]|nr:MAG: ATP synthase F0 subunit B [Nitrospinae bacterium CG11_big_fil_rev_8_21_14_0_20_56_8]
MPQFEQVGVFSSLIFWSLISFAILLYLLWRYAFPPIIEALEDREKKIRDDIDAAERMKQEGQKLKADLEAELKKAHEKANTIVQMASDESRKIQERTLHETQAKVRQMQEDAQQEIQVLHHKLLGEIRGYTAALTIATAEKFLKKAIDDAEGKRMVNESIDEVIRSLEKQARN